MAQDPRSPDQPLSPGQMSVTEFRIPRHQSPAPDFDQERPRRRFHAVKRSTDPSTHVPAAPPSMPSYDSAMKTMPDQFPMSPPARLLFAGHELEPLIIFPPDGRRLYDDRTFPWRCVCKVFSGSRGGNGVLIGPRHVLTASHVIDWNASSDTVQLMQGGVLLASASSTDALAYEFIDDVTYNNADDDYAILVLNARIGDSFGMLGARTYDAGWDNRVTSWFNIAYAPDLSQSTPCFQTGFFLDEDDFDLGAGRMLISKTCDAVRGMSGSPIFGFWAEGPFVVGVTSAGGGGALGNLNAYAGGSNLTRLVSQARSQFP